MLPGDTIVMSRHAILSHRPANEACGIDPLWTLRWLVGHPDGICLYKVAHFRTEAGARVWAADHDLDVDSPLPLP